MRNKTEDIVNFIINMILNNEKNKLSKFLNTYNLKRDMFFYYQKIAYNILVEDYYTKGKYYNKIKESNNKKLNQKILLHNV